MRRVIASILLVILTFPLLYTAFADVSTEEKGAILVDLTHANRITINGVTSPNLDTSENSRIFDWTSWAEDLESQGYRVDLLTEEPITYEKLQNYTILVVGQPDVTSNGPAYFTDDEANAIKQFLENGGNLLLVGNQLVGGNSLMDYMGDYETVYYYPQIFNDLLSKLGVDDLRFAEGMVNGDPLDVMASDNSSTQLGGPKGNIWITEGKKDHPIWSGLDKFAYFHGCSLNVSGNATAIAWGDDSVYTSPKNGDYSPKVKPEGSHPVAIAEVKYGNGKILAFGCAADWQSSSPFGDVYTNENNKIKILTRNMINYLATGTAGGEAKVNIVVNVNSAIGISVSPSTVYINTTPGSSIEKVDAISVKNTGSATIDIYTKASGDLVGKISGYTIPISNLKFKGGDVDEYRAYSTEEQLLKSDLGSDQSFNVSLRLSVPSDAPSDEYSTTLIFIAKQGLILCGSEFFFFYFY